MRTKDLMNSQYSYLNSSLSDTYSSGSATLYGPEDLSRGFKQELDSAKPSSLRGAFYEVDVPSIRPHLSKFKDDGLVYSAGSNVEYTSGNNPKTDAFINTTLGIAGGMGVSFYNRYKDDPNLFKRIVAGDNNHLPALTGKELQKLKIKIFAPIIIGAAAGYAYHHFVDTWRTNPLRELKESPYKEKMQPLLEGATYEPGTSINLNLHAKTLASEDSAFISTGNMGVLFNDKKDGKLRQINFGVKVTDKSTVEDINKVLSIYSSGIGQEENVYDRISSELKSGNVVISGKGAGDKARQQLISLIEEADSDIYLSEAYATDKYIFRALADAERAGKSVKILAQNPLGKKGGGAQDRTAEMLSNAVDAGVEVYMTPANSNLLQHSKTIFTDKAAFVGSHNFSGTSFDNVLELGVIVKDPTIGRAGMSSIDKTIKAHNFLSLKDNPELFRAANELEFGVKDPERINKLKEIIRLREKGVKDTTVGVTREDIKQLLKPKINGKDSYGIVIPYKMPETYFTSISEGRPNIFRRLHFAATGEKPEGLKDFALTQLDKQMAPQSGLDLLFYGGFGSSNQGLTTVAGYTLAGAAGVTPILGAITNAGTKTRLGIGLSLGAATGALSLTKAFGDLYTPGKGSLGTVFSGTGRLLDIATGQYANRRLEDDASGKTSGRLSELHAMQYESSSKPGLFESVLNYTENLVSGTAVGLGFYFGVSHAWTMVKTHLEEVGMASLTDIEGILESYDTSYGLGSNAKAAGPFNREKVVPTSDFITKFHMNNFLAAGDVARIQAGVSGRTFGEVFDAVLEYTSLQAARDLGFEGSVINTDIPLRNRISDLTAQAFDQKSVWTTDYLTLQTRHILGQLINYGQVDIKDRESVLAGIRFIEKNFYGINTVTGEVNATIGLNNRKKLEEVVVLGSYNVAASEYDHELINVLRRVDASNFENVTRPILEHIAVVGDNLQEKQMFKEAINKLSEVISAPPIISYKEAGAYTRVKTKNVGFTRVEELAKAFDAVSRFIPASPLYYLPQVRQLVGMTSLRQYDADGRVIEGTDQSLKQFIGPGFSGLISASKKIYSRVIDTVKKGFQVQLAETMKVFADERAVSRYENKVQKEAVKILKNNKKELTTLAERLQKEGMSAELMQDVTQALYGSKGSAKPGVFSEIADNLLEDTNSLKTLESYETTRVNLNTYTRNAPDIGTGATSKTTFAALRKNAALVGSVLILDKVVDANIMQHQGVDLFTQIGADLVGVNQDENNEGYATTRYSAVTPFYLKYPAAIAGALVGGHLLGDIITKDSAAGIVANTINSQFGGLFDARAIAAKDVGATTPFSPYLSSNKVIKANISKQAAVLSSMNLQRSGIRFSRTGAFLGAGAGLIVSQTFTGALSLIANLVKNSEPEQHQKYFNDALGLLAVDLPGASNAFTSKSSNEKPRELLEVEPMALSAAATLLAGITQEMNKYPTGIQDSLLSSKLDSALAISSVLLSATNESTKPIYSSAYQIPNPVFQLAFLSKVDPRANTISYGAGFQFLPILGVGSTPSFPFVFRLRRTATKFEEHTIRGLDTAYRLDPSAEDKLKEEDDKYSLAASLLSMDLIGIERESPFFSNLNLSGALLTLGAGVGVLKNKIKLTDGTRLSNEVQSIAPLFKTIGAGFSIAEKLVRYSQVPNLIIPSLVHTNVDKILRAQKPIAVLNRAIHYGAYGSLAGSILGFPGALLGSIAGASVATLGALAEITVPNAEALNEHKRNIRTSNIFYRYNTVNYVTGDGLKISRPIEKFARKSAPYVLSMVAARAALAPSGGDSYIGFEYESNIGGLGLSRSKFLGEAYKLSAVIGVAGAYGYAFDKAGVFRDASAFSGMKDDGLFRTPQRIIGELYNNSVIEEIKKSKDLEMLETYSKIKNRVLDKATKQGIGLDVIDEIVEKETNARVIASSKKSKSIFYRVAQSTKPKVILAAPNRLALAGIAYFGTTTAMTVLGNVLSAASPDNSATNFLLAPFRLVAELGQGNLSKEEQDYRRSMGVTTAKNKTPTNLGEAISNIGNYFSSVFYPIKAIGQALGIYQDTPKPFLNAFGPFGFAQGARGVKAYTQVASATQQDISGAVYDLNRSLISKDLAFQIASVMNGKNISIYNALARFRGAPARRNPMQMKNSISSSEMSALSAASPELSKAVEIRQFLLQNLTNQRSIELSLDFIEENARIGRLGKSSKLGIASWSPLDALNTGYIMAQDIFEEGLEKSEYNRIGNKLRSTVNYVVTGKQLGIEDLTGVINNRRQVIPDISPYGYAAGLAEFYTKNKYEQKYSREGVSQHNHFLMMAGIFGTTIMLGAAATATTIAFRSIFGAAAAAKLGGVVTLVERDISDISNQIKYQPRHFTHTSNGEVIYAPRRGQGTVYKIGSDFLSNLTEPEAQKVAQKLQANFKSITDELSDIARGGITIQKGYPATPNQLHTLTTDQLAYRAHPVYGYAGIPVTTSEYITPFKEKVRSIFDRKLLINGQPIAISKILNLTDDQVKDFLSDDKFAELEAKIEAERNRRPGSIKNRQVNIRKTVASFIRETIEPIFKGVGDEYVEHLAQGFSDERQYLRYQRSLYKNRVIKQRAINSAVVSSAADVIEELGFVGTIKAGSLGISKLGTKLFGFAQIYSLGSTFTKAMSSDSSMERDRASYAFGTISAQMATTFVGMKALGLVGGLGVGIGLATAAYLLDQFQFKGRGTQEVVKAFDYAGKNFYRPLVEKIGGIAGATNLGVLGKIIGSPFRMIDPIVNKLHSSVQGSPGLAFLTSMLLPDTTDTLIEYQKGYLPGTQTLQGARQEIFSEKELEQYRTSQLMRRRSRTFSNRLGINSDLISSYALGGGYSFDQVITSQKYFQDRQQGSVLSNFATSGGTSSLLKLAISRRHAQIDRDVNASYMRQSILYRDVLSPLSSIFGGLLKTSQLHTGSAFTSSKVLAENILSISNKVVSEYEYWTDYASRAEDLFKALPKSTRYSMLRNLRKSQKSYYEFRKSVASKISSIKGILPKPNVKVAAKKSNILRLPNIKLSGELIEDSQKALMGGAFAALTVGTLISGGLEYAKTTEWGSKNKETLTNLQTYGAYGGTFATVSAISLYRMQSLDSQGLPRAGGLPNWVLNPTLGTLGKTLTKGVAGATLGGFVGIGIYSIGKLVVSTANKLNQNNLKKREDKEAKRSKDLEIAAALAGAGYYFVHYGLRNRSIKESLRADPVKRSLVGAWSLFNDLLGAHQEKTKFAPNYRFPEWVQKGKHWTEITKDLFKEHVFDNLPKGIQTGEVADKFFKWANTKGTAFYTNKLSPAYQQTKLLASKYAPSAIDTYLLFNAGSNLFSTGKRSLRGEIENRYKDVIGLTIGSTATSLLPAMSTAFLNQRMGALQTIYSSMILQNIYTSRLAKLAADADYRDYQAGRNPNIRRGAFVLGSIALAGGSAYVMHKTAARFTMPATSVPTVLAGLTGLDILNSTLRLNSRINENNGAGATGDILGEEFTNLNSQFLMSTSTLPSFAPKALGLVGMLANEGFAKYYGTNLADRMVTRGLYTTKHQKQMLKTIGQAQTRGTISGLAGGLAYALGRNLNVSNTVSSAIFSLTAGRLISSYASAEHYLNNPDDFRDYNAAETILQSVPSTLLSAGVGYGLGKVNQLPAFSKVKSGVVTGISNRIPAPVKSFTVDVSSRYTKALERTRQVGNNLIAKVPGSKAVGNFISTKASVPTTSKFAPLVRGMRGLGILSMALSVAQIGFSAVGSFTAPTEELRREHRKNLTKATSAIALGIAGAAVGAQIGAAIGAAAGGGIGAVPVGAIGAAVGFVGGVIGGIAGDIFGGWAYDKVDPTKATSKNGRALFQSSLTKLEPAKPRYIAPQSEKLSASTPSNKSNNVSLNFNVGEFLSNIPVIGDIFAPKVAVASDVIPEGAKPFIQQQQKRAAGIKTSFKASPTVKSTKFTTSVNYSDDEREVEKPWWQQLTDYLGGLTTRVITYFSRLFGGRQEASTEEADAYFNSLSFEQMQQLIAEARAAGPGKYVQGPIPLGNSQSLVADGTGGGGGGGFSLEKPDSGVQKGVRLTFYGVFEKSAYKSQAMANIQGGSMDFDGGKLVSLQQALRTVDKEGNQTQAVSIAIDSNFLNKKGKKGKRFDYGQLVAIRNTDPAFKAKYGRDTIIGKLVDTGGAFKGKGLGRLDIASEDASIHNMVHVGTTQSGGEWWALPGNAKDGLGNIKGKLTPPTSGTYSMGSNVGGGRGANSAFVRPGEYRAGRDYFTNSVEAYTDKRRNDAGRSLEYSTRVNMDIPNPFPVPIKYVGNVGSTPKFVYTQDFVMGGKRFKAGEETWVFHGETLRGTKVGDVYQTGQKYFKTNLDANGGRLFVAPGRSLANIVIMSLPKKEGGYYAISSEARSVLREFNQRMNDSLAGKYYKEGSSTYTPQPVNNQSYSVSSAPVASYNPSTPSYSKVVKRESFKVISQGGSRYGTKLLKPGATVRDILPHHSPRSDKGFGEHYDFNVFRKDTNSTSNVNFYSPIDGVVVQSRAVGGYGWLVDVRNPNNPEEKYRMAHLRDASPLKVGQVIKAGDFVGVQGGTTFKNGKVSVGYGVHYHIETTDHTMNKLLKAWETGEYTSNSAGSNLSGIPSSIRSTALYTQSVLAPEMRTVVPKQTIVSNTGKRLTATSTFKDTGEHHTVYRSVWADKLTLGKPNEKRNISASEVSKYRSQGKVVSIPRDYSVFGTDGKRGQPQRAIRSGIVNWAGYSKEDGIGYGVVVTDEQGRFLYRYKHQKGQPLVKTGDRVVAGQILGYEGNTGVSFGNHMHLDATEEIHTEMIQQAYSGVYTGRSISSNPTPNTNTPSQLSSNQLAKVILPNGKVASIPERFLNQQQPVGPDPNAPSVPFNVIPTKGNREGTVPITPDYYKSFSSPRGGLTNTQIKPGNAVKEGAGTLRRARSKNWKAELGVPSKIMITVGHAEKPNGGTSGRSNRSNVPGQSLEYQYNKLIVGEIARLTPEYGLQNQIQVYTGKDKYQKIIEWEQQGIQVIEIHNDEPRGGSGVIPPYANGRNKRPGITVLDDILAGEYGAFSRGHRAEAFEGAGLGLMHAGATILEVGPLNAEVERILLYGSPAEKQRIAKQEAIRFLTNVVKANQLRSEPSTPISKSNQRLNPTKPNALNQNQTKPTAKPKPKPQTRASADVIKAKSDLSASAKTQITKAILTAYEKLDKIPEGLTIAGNWQVQTEPNEATSNNNVVTAEPTLAKKAPTTETKTVEVATSNNSARPKMTLNVKAELTIDAHSFTIANGHKQTDPMMTISEGEPVFL